MTGAVTISDRDRAFMKEALRLAARGAGGTSPNPMVGAVVVRDGVVVGRGYHEYAGGPHAEVNALRDAGEKAGGADLFVTLEPCNHHGRTPPCTAAVLAAGVSRVVVGMGDPNPRVEGGGTEFLRARGVRVDQPVLERECRLLNQAFIKHSTTGLPLVVLKAAATLDGRIATRTGDSRWITNERSRRFVHGLRCDLDGILVGIGTALADDPQLTARIRRKPACRQPVRIVLDAGLRLPTSSALARTAREVPVWVACSEHAPAENEAQLRDAGVDVLRLPVLESGFGGSTRPGGCDGADGACRVDPAALLRELGKRNITSVLVEGGGSVHGAFIDARLADEFHFFYAPKVLGDRDSVPMVSGSPRESMADALPVHDIRVRRFGGDVLLSGRFREEIY